MKNIILMACFMLGIYGVSAQTYTSTSGNMTVTLSDSMWHDSTMCQGYDSLVYIITFDTSALGDSVNIVDTTDGVLLNTYYNTTGASPWTVNAPIYDYGTYDEVAPGGYMYFGNWPLKVAGMRDTLWGISNYDSLIVYNPCGWSTAWGQVYNDNNANCVFDSGDAPLAGVAVNFVEYLSSPVDSLNWMAQTDSFSGDYGFNVQTSWFMSYVISIPPSYSFIFPASPCFTGTSYTLTTFPIDSANFPLECSSNVDVQCGLLSAGRLRLHRNFYVQPYVSNTGCDTVSGEMTMVIDSRMTYDSALTLNPPDTVRGDTLIWNYSGLSSLTAGAYWNSFFSNVCLTPDGTIAVGDTLCFRVYTNIPPTDVNPANNDYTICMPAVYSFDPNSKEVSPSGSFFMNQDTLTYTIHFQNTGSDTAQNVVIIDTLNAHFNKHTLKVLGASANMTPQWLTPNVVEFNFNNINLPDSFDNEAASHGEVQFQIVLDSATSYGTPISNTAYIYFDLNPAVVTNTTMDTLAMPNMVANVAPRLPVRIYPNPATDKIYVEHLGGGEISIISMDGSTVLTQTVTGDNVPIDIARLPDGIYMIKATNGNSTTTVKFTKL